MQQLKIIGCLLAIVATINPLHGLSISHIGDVEIYMNETYWKCDKIDCPPEANMCRVTKQKLNPDDTQVKRVNTCYSKNNEVLAETTNYDPIAATENISLNVSSYRDGGIVSLNDGEQFDQKQIDANIKHIEAEVKEDLRNIEKQTKRQMQELRAQLKQDLGNLFNDWI